MRIFINAFIMFVLLGYGLCTSSNAECGKINLYYNERPPYLKTTPSGVTGLTGDPATMVFEKAGVPFEWMQMPTKLQMQAIQDNSECACAVGWFKNPDREKFAKFTLPIYQDRSQIGLVRKDNTNLRSGATVDQTLSRPDLTLAIKDGYSYGKFIDTKIAKYNPKKDITTGETDQMVKKIFAKKADFFFITPEEADVVIAAAGLSKDNFFKYISFSDMPPGENRYILCTQQVDDALMKKLDDAITGNIKIQ